jgi:hypothetical protein
VARLWRSLADVCCESCVWCVVVRRIVLLWPRPCLYVAAAFEQLQRLQVQVDADHKAASRAQDAASAKGAEARSCHELLRADVLCFG